METIFLLVGGLFGRQLLHLGLVQIAILDGDWNRQCIFFGTPAKPQMHSPNTASTEISFRLSLAPSFPDFRFLYSPNSKEQLHPVNLDSVLLYPMVAQTLPSAELNADGWLCRYHTDRCVLAPICARMWVFFRLLFFVPLEITSTFSAPCSQGHEIALFFFFFALFIPYYFWWITFIVQ